MESKSNVILRSPRSGRLEGRTEPAGEAGDASTAPAKRICVGIVTGAHGVRGAVRVKSFTADPKDVARYGPLEDESGERRWSLGLMRSVKGVVVCRVDGIADRDRAEALRGLRLYLPRAALPPTGEEEYYHADLIGLQALLADGTMLGQVRAIHDFGAGDTLEIIRPAGPPAMVPFTRAIVPIVDLAAGRLVVDPPPGLIEPTSNKPSPPAGGEARVRGGLASSDGRDDPLTPALSPKGAREKKEERA